MTLNEALSITMPYIKYLAHNGRLYDREDIIQEGMIGTWLASERIDDDKSLGEKTKYLKKSAYRRIENFKMSNLVHVSVGRTKLAELIKEGVDVIAKWQAFPCEHFDRMASKEMGPFKQACFNEGLKNVKKREDINDYI